MHDALTPKNVGQDEIHKDPTLRASPQHAFSRSSPPCAVAFTGSYVSPNNAVNSVLWKRVYGTEFRSGPASRKHSVNRTLQAGRATTLGGCRERRDERGGLGEPSRLHPRETSRTRGEIGMEHLSPPCPAPGRGRTPRGGAGWGGANSSSRRSKVQLTYTTTVTWRYWNVEDLVANYFILD